MLVTGFVIYCCFGLIGCVVLLFSLLDVGLLVCFDLSNRLDLCVCFAF